jgi:hypothetical protein
MVMITKIKKIIISLVVVFLPLLAVSTVWMPGTASAATCGDPVAKNAI